MDAKMDGRIIDGWEDQWTDGRMEIRINRFNRWMDGWIDMDDNEKTRVTKCIDRMNNELYRRSSRQTDRNLEYLKE
eukprot:scaffold513753_cov27-Prasinocladus_malaysianus.AAC.1